MYERWMADVAGPAIVIGVIDRYGWGIFGYDDGSAEIRPAVLANNTEPGEMDEDTVASLICNASITFRAESNPGTPNVD